jgi:hypothetical protein
MIEKITSGFQSGADIAGIRTALKFGIATGGWMPRGFKTLDGPRPKYQYFGAMEHRYATYPPRTFANVKDSDGTMRFAANWESPGEICTFRAILQYVRPYFDVDLINLDPKSMDKAVTWIEENNIKILNIAGNAEKTHKGCEQKVSLYLEKLFTRLGHEKIM